MSANNYRVCPRCATRAIEKYETGTKHLEEAYGQVTQEEYEKLKSELGEPPDLHKAPDTLQERWELYTNVGGEFVVWYCCTCEACGFKFGFKHGEQLELNE